MTYAWSEELSDFPDWLTQLDDPTIDAQSDENKNNNCGMLTGEAQLLYSTGVRNFADEIKDAVLKQGSVGLTNQPEITGYLNGTPYKGQPIGLSRCSVSSRVFLPTVGNAPDGRTGVFNLAWGALKVKKGCFCLTRYSPGSSVMHWRSLLWLGGFVGGGGDVDLHEPWGGGRLSTYVGHRLSWTEFMRDYYVQPDPAIGSCFVVVDRKRVITNDQLMGWDV